MFMPGILFYLAILCILSAKAMAPHSSTLARRIPGMGVPGGRRAMGSHRVGQDRSDLAAAAVGEGKLDKQ